MSYTTEELYQCIFECMSESLPESWETASVYATIQGADVKSVFRYTEEGSNREVEYTPENFVAPLNALVELQKIAAGEGRHWSSIDLHINPEGQIKFATR